MSTQATGESNAPRREHQTVAQAEPARNRKVYAPHVDIYESQEGFTLFADMPGVNENSVNVMLEKNELTLYGAVNFQPPKGYQRAHAEYDIGDYQRAFVLSDEVDREGISATVKDGVLRLALPKAKPAKARKITVQSV